MFRWKAPHLLRNTQPPTRSGRNIQGRIPLRSVWSLNSRLRPRLFTPEATPKTHVLRSSAAIGWESDTGVKTKMKHLVSSSCFRYSSLQETEWNRKREDGGSVGQRLGVFEGSTPPYNRSNSFQIHVQKKKKWGVTCSNWIWICSGKNVGKQKITLLQIWWLIIIIK